MTATARRPRLPHRLHGRRLPRPGPRVLAGLIVIVAILVGIFFWVRQSSLVAVRHVTITGVSGPDAAQIRSALTSAALGTSTLDVDARRLHEAVAPYSVVRAVHLHTDFPHGLRITVSEEVPVAVLIAGGQRVLVSADGTLLRGTRQTGSLPTVTSPDVPGGEDVTGEVRNEISLLAAAPYALLAKVASVSAKDPSGLTAALRNGPAIVFGDAAEAAAKWRAAVDVLANSSSAGASYIDVTDPARPAAGAGDDQSGATGTANAPSTSQTAGSAAQSGQTATNSTSTTG